MQVHIEWGEAGARALAKSCDVLVIVDVLSFTTAVDVAASRGASVIPGARYAAAAAELARRERAVLAVARRRVSAQQPYSLSPPTLANIPKNTRLVLPSPNGSAITVAAAKVHGVVMAGCLRNASAVAAAAAARGARIGVIAAGERWDDNSLRVALEDLVGAGAIIAAMPNVHRSAEAAMVAYAFERARTDLEPVLSECVSGRELIEYGFRDDVRMASELDVSSAVPVLIDGAYVSQDTSVGM